MTLSRSLANRGAQDRAFYSTGVDRCPRVVPAWLLLAASGQASDLVGRLGPRGSIRRSEFQVFLEASQGGCFRPRQKFGLSQLEIHFGPPSCLVGNSGLRLAKMVDGAGRFSAIHFHSAKTVVGLGRFGIRA